MLRATSIPFLISTSTVKASARASTGAFILEASTSPALSSEATRASELVFDRCAKCVHVEPNLPLVGEACGRISVIEVVFGELVIDIFAANDPVGSKCVLYAAADVPTVQPSVLGNVEWARARDAGPEIDTFVSANVQPPATYSSVFG